MKEIWLWWSSGKDSAWALHELRRRGEYRVTRLLTTVDRDASRVPVHGVRRQLLEAQARSAGLPLRCVELPVPTRNAVYEAAVAELLEEAAAAGVSAMAFGDLFLEDIRAYRLQLFSGTGIEPVFPLWGRATDALAREMIDFGLRARLTSVDLRALDAGFAGVPFDLDFLERLPDGVDPCGENGEFHTVVAAGPMFETPLHLRPGVVEQRGGFAFADFFLDEAE